MTALAFQTAVRENVLARVFVVGATGSGKTFAALRIAQELAPVEKTYVVDCENGRALLEADNFPGFQHAMLHSHGPAAYTEAMNACWEAGAEAVILDSVSPEWKFTLSLADRFGKWKDVRPPHDAWVQSMIDAPGHLIVTCRAKMKYNVTEDDKGKQRIDPVGMGPVQDENLPYEFDVVAYLDRDHLATFSNRCRPLDGKTMEIPEAAPIIAKWLAEGEKPKPPPEADPARVKVLLELVKQEGVLDEKGIGRVLDAARAENRGVLHPDWVEQQIKGSEQRQAAKVKA